MARDDAAKILAKIQNAVIFKDTHREKPVQTEDDVRIAWSTKVLAKYILFYRTHTCS